MSGVRSTLNGFSNVIVGPTTCARADITVLSTLGTISVPTYRMRVSSIGRHRGFERVSCTNVTYRTRFVKLKFSKCGGTVRCLYRGCGWGDVGWAKLWN